ncbi:PD-(D/E)XK nuclease family protein [Campylobacter iguaniorum]|uniref:PD-(D/E)XK nuclease family protein n=1 Tax=Campylobacter iguaniorum TaxID=1244531 RepID=UPI00084987FC|nr:PD-(D/E)XK nuclease family protein [Campylobacter iguaniorum]
MIAWDFINLNYTQNRELYVLSSSRNIRDFLEQNCTNSLLPKVITIFEFNQTILLVNGLKKATDTTRLLIMQEAAKATKAVSSELNISTEFFAFLKNSSYLFSFFQELEREFVSIDTLKNSDTYANYDEHLDILQELKNLYFKLLEEHGFYDDITICTKFSINESYIKQFDKIHLKIDGMLSKFDWKVLQEVAKISDLNIYFNSSKYNQKLINAIENITNLELKTGFEYTLNLSQNKIIAQTKTPKNSKIKLKEFSIRSLQCAYIFDEISNFIRSGIEPKNIAVILPDEDFYRVLKALDERDMLNYAMGESLTYQNIFILCDSLKQALDSNLMYKKMENYLELAKDLDQLSSTLNFFKFDDELYKNLNLMYRSNCTFERFYELFDLIKSHVQISNEVGQILENELFVLKQLLSSVNLDFATVFEIFLMKLKDIKLSMVGGGEVTVMGLLESRSKNYEGVIIVDFNDNFVPRKSQKEMFLSSAIRKKSGLISHQDRENLQRFYYESLINRAKQVSISYTKNEESLLSRFAMDFAYENDLTHSQNDYQEALNLDGIEPNLKPEDPVCKHDFFGSSLSFSRLNTYLACKKKYYYKYILKLKEYRNFTQESTSNELGSTIHAALQLYFTTHKDSFNKNEFLSILNKFKNQQNLLDMSVFELRLDKFAEVQNSYFKLGYKVAECEKELNNEFCGVKIEGVIDRIDIGEEIRLIDYKSGKIDESSLQLAFYQALYGVECEGYFYSIKENEFISSKKTIEDLRSLIESLKDEFTQEVCFERTNKSETCKYCDYALFCKKELK